ncbi:MAG TPA: hypothetical protein VFY87_24685, partial [Geminicoccaceae bacterium]|nr:hypothetical protein [Geminicoccaceae bacterium]
DLAECGAKGLLKRFHYASFGADDDAQLVTPEFYDRFLEQYEGSEDDEGFADLERERLSRKFIGTKWLVVVDYHT